MASLVSATGTRLKVTPSFAAAGVSPVSHPA